MPPSIVHFFLCTGVISQQAKAQTKITRRGIWEKTADSIRMRKFFIQSKTDEIWDCNLRGITKLDTRPFLKEIIRDDKDQSRDYSDH